MLRRHSQAGKHAVILYYQAPCGRIKNGAYNKNVPRKKLQKNADTKIEYFHPYTAELVQNIPKYRISDKNYRPIFVGGLDSFYVNISAMLIKII